MTSPANALKQKYCSRICTFEALKVIPPLLDSLAAKLAARQSPQPNGCILYTGQNNGTYGQIGYRLETHLAHRAAYMVHKGPIPEGACVCHGCDTPLCINPDHLWLGSYSDNVQDMYAKRRANHAKKTKLTETQVREVRAARAAQVSAETIAASYGISRSYVYDIFRGRARSHV